MHLPDVLRALRVAYRSAVGGKGRLVILSGDGGLGKTFAARRFLQLTRRTLVLDGQGRPGSQRAFYPIYEPIARILQHRADTKSRLQRIVAQYLARLPRIGPYLEPIVLELDRKILEVPEIDPAILQTSPNPHVLTLVKRIAREDLPVLWIDDLQWADQETLSFLMYLRDKIAVERLFVLLTLRERAPAIENKDTLSQTLDFLSPIRSETVKLLQFRPLNQEETLSLVRHELQHSVALDEQDVESLMRKTRGIPYLVSVFLTVIKDHNYLQLRNGALHLLRPLRDIGFPESLREAIRRRVDRLYRTSPESRPLLELASVIGEHFSDNVLDEVLGLCDSFTLLRLIEENSLLVRSLPQKHLWEFEHATVREILYESQGREVHEIHRLVADYLATHNQNDPSAIAYHYRLAGDDKKYTHYALASVKQALQFGYFQEAWQTLSALEPVISPDALDPLTTEGQQYLRLIVEVLFNLGKFDKCVELADAFLAIVDEYELPRWDLVEAKAKCLAKSIDKNELRAATDYLLNELSRPELLENTQVKGNLYGILSVLHAHLNQGEEARSAFSTAETLYRESASTMHLSRLLRRSPMVMEPELAQRLVARAVSYFREANYYADLVMALTNLAAVNLNLGEVTDAERALLEALKVSTALGDFHVDYIENNLAIVAFQAQDYESAMRHIALAQEHSARPVTDLIIRLNEAVIRCALGDPETAYDSLLEALSETYRSGELSYLLPHLLNLAALALALARYRECFLYLAASAPLSDPIYHHLFDSRRNEILRIALARVSAIMNENEVPEMHLKEQVCLIEMQFWTE